VNVVMIIGALMFQIGLARRVFYTSIDASGFGDRRPGVGVLLADVALDGSTLNLTDTSYGGGDGAVGRSSASPVTWARRWSRSPARR